MEQVARAQYLVNKDPKESALLYVALERRSLLAGLLKISKDERDKALVNFLARDFKVTHPSPVQVSQEKKGVVALQKSVCFQLPRALAISFSILPNLFLKPSCVYS
jgi:hypothetical protein